jgi:two-component system KDP operon response regulator KdpE
MSNRILVIDDEPQIRKFLHISLGANGYDVCEAENARNGIEAALSNPPDLIILDLGLPDLDGQDAISELRQTLDTPIIILSVRSQEFDKVEALDRGANDFIVKPFGIAELIARVRVWLRPKSGKEPTNVIELGSVIIDLERHIVTRDGQEVRLSKKEWDLLRYMAERPDHVLTHKVLLKEVWGPAHVDDTAYLRVYVNQLRQKLEEKSSQPTLIVTEPGIGYRLKRGE